jgi:histone acetyltransferase (RNA polymerase elongator complex component)
MRTPAAPTADRRPFIVPVFLPHAGCPHRCVFCNQGAITAGADPCLGAAAIRERIDAHLRFRSGRRDRAEIAFYGGNFLGLPPERARELLNIGREYVARGQVEGLRFSTRPDTVDRLTTALFREYPVTTVEIGVQSMDDRVLAAARRGHTAAATEHAVALLKSTPARVGVQLMVGLPGEEAGGCLESARRAAALAPDFVRIYPTVVLGGSRLAEWYRQGVYRPLDLTEAVGRVTEVFRVFRRLGIPVVRMGLQAQTELGATGSVLAGPYHPAFGHMVYAALFQEAAAAALRDAGGAPGDVRLRVNPRSISRMQGLKNANLEALRHRFGLTALRVEADEAIPPDELRVADGPAVKVY